MGRNIITIADQTGVQNDNVPGQVPDNYASQIVKLIPIEIVGVYLGISNLIKEYYTIQWFIFGIILVLTPIYLKKVAGISDKAQMWVATASYVIWAISLGGPFEHLLEGVLPDGFTVAALGGILIMLYTLVVPIIYRPAKA
jgi:hypothetical protein